MFAFEKHKILWLEQEKEQFYDVDMDRIYKKMNGWEKIKFRANEHDILRENKSIFYGKWKDNVADYDTIILGDGIRGRDVLEYIREKNPNVRIIIYYGNTTSQNERSCPDNYKGFRAEFYTFDPGNAKEFGMNFKPLYFGRLRDQWFPNLTRKERDNLTYDVFFIGVDKGRLNSLIDLKKKLSKIGLNSYIHVVRDKHKTYFGEKARFAKKTGLPVEKTLDYTLASKAVLDLVKPGQTGITARTMEAVFTNRKIITNNPYIVNYDIYNPRNVFILGEAPIESLKKFLKIDYEPISKEILMKYRKEIWLDSFF